MRLVILPLVVAGLLLACPAVIAAETPVTKSASTLKENQNTNLGTEPITFKLSENNASAVGSQVLNSGTNLQFSSSNFKPNEVLLLSKCGVPCNTAKEVGVWKASNLVPGSLCKIEVTEPGNYYFWIQQTTPTGETGPVFGTSTKVKGKTTIVNYASGTSVSVTVSKP